MGYNLKNARSGKSISKIPIWPSLSFLAFKSEFICLFKFFGRFKVLLWKMLLKSKALLSSNFFFKIQSVIKSHFFIARGFNLGYFDVFDMLFLFLAFLKLQPIIL